MKSTSLLLSVNGGGSRLLADMSECTPAPVPLVVYIPQVIDEFVRETPVLSLVGQEWKDTAR